MKILKTLPTEEQKIEIVNLFFENFSKIFQNLKLFSKDNKKLLEYLGKNLNYENVICIINEDEIIGVLGFKVINKSFINYKRSNFIEVFGHFGGNYRYLSNMFIGFFESVPKKDEIVIEMVAVNSKFRSMGIGTLLINQILDIGKKEKKSKILLEVVNTNPRAKFLYEKLGFQVKKKTYFGFLTYNSGFSSVEYMFKEI